MTYRDRLDAGKQLAAQLSDYATATTCWYLHAPLDIFLAKAGCSGSGGAGQGRNHYGRRSLLNDCPGETPTEKCDGLRDKKKN